MLNGTEVMKKFKKFKMAVVRHLEFRYITMLSRLANVAE